MYKRVSEQQKGFTIVELLIVVVVIAILAAITIVAYNGIQNRASDSVVQSDLDTLAKKVKIGGVEDGELFVPSGLSQSQPNTQDKQELTSNLPFSQSSYTRNGVAFLYTVGNQGSNHPTPLFAAVSKSGKVYVYDGSTLSQMSGAWDQDAVLNKFYESAGSVGWSCQVNYYTWSYADGWQSDPQYC